MKKKAIKYSILVCIFIIIIVGIIYKVNGEEEDETTTVSETEVIKTDILNTLSTSSYISTALEENKQLHTGYYFSEIYVEENEYVAQGTEILQYTNGESLVAPYNCVITSIMVPNSGEICTNNHYITIQSTDTLQMSLQIEEDELDIVYVGQEAQIEIEALDKTVTGYVTKIDNTATYSSSGSNFGVEVEFENDGDILLGMSATCSIVLEKAEDAIAVANEAIQEQGGKKYVTVQNEDGTTEDVEIETGIENDAYTEVISGLNEGDIVLIIEETEETNTGGQMRGGGNMEQNQGMDEMPSGEAPSGDMGGEAPSGGDMQMPNN